MTAGQKDSTPHGTPLISLRWRIFNIIVYKYKFVLIRSLILSRISITLTDDDVQEFRQIDMDCVYIKIKDRNKNDKLMKTFFIEFI